jgi:hypothetical protein
VDGLSRFAKPYEEIEANEKSAVTINRVRWLRAYLLLSFCLWMPSSSFPQTPHCGQERWAIKTGTDSGAAAIDLANPKPTTILSLVAPIPPAPIPPDIRVGPEETSAWVVTGTLTGFKLESDSDYHLVVQDGSGTNMIVEIPLPDCTQQSSAFFAGISKARSAFDARFTPGTSFQNVSVPVRIMGVGMFDFAHGQRGFAPNGIELHPVLDIQFLDRAGSGGPLSPGPSTQPPSSSPAPGGGLPGQLLQDPSFESGAAGPWAASRGVIDNSTTEPAHSGNWKAWFGGTGKAHTDRLSQSVSIPASAVTANLSFWLRITTERTTKTKDEDTLVITIKDEKGNELNIEDQEGDPYSNLDVMPYTLVRYDMSRFIGHNVTLTFTVKEARGKNTSFLVDDVRLIIR